MNHRIFRTIRRTSKPLIFLEIDSAPHVFLLVVLTELEPIFFVVKNSYSLTSGWSTGHPLLPDFFLDETPETLVEKMEQHGEHLYYKQLY